MKEYKLPEVIRKIMKEKGISQNKLADLMDTSQGTVNQWVTGKALPSMYSLMELADVLGVTLDYLVLGE